MKNILKKKHITTNQNIEKIHIITDPNYKIQIFDIVNKLQCKNHSKMPLFLLTEIFNNVPLL